MIEDISMPLKMQSYFFNLLYRVFSISVPAPTATSWLDGLRGYASLVVSMAHLRNGWTDIYDTGYGSRPQDTSLLQLPIIRIVSAGPAMVAMFYFVSGYSLSLGAFKDLQKGSSEKALARIRSSAFRRYVRLYLPVICTSFLVLLCIVCGLYDHGIATDSRDFTKDEIPIIFHNPFDQIKDWWSACLEFLNVWKEPRHRYYVHSWSIPVEFCCSMILNLCLGAIATLRLRPRVAVLALLVVYSHITAEYFMWTFFLGALVCQLLSQRIYTSQWENDFPPVRKEFRANVVCYVVFIFGVYTLAYPSGFWETAPFYGFLRLYMPLHWAVPAWFWHGVGAAVISIAVAQNANVQHIFSCRAARFLGRVSYALYLVHGIVIRCLGIWLVPMMFKITGSEGHYRMELGFLLAFSIQIPVTLLAATVFTKLFDDSSITLSKLIEKKLEAVKEPQHQRAFETLPI